MSDVPSEMFREVLLRLPAETLFRLRSVCKSWRSIIDDPSFVRSHTTNNHRISPSPLLLGTRTGAFYSFSLDSLNYVNGEQTIHATHVTHAKKLTDMDIGISIGEFWMALCNGLILFFHRFTDKNWVIWNPLTGDFHELPQHDVINGRPIPMGVGIGYDSRSDDYKVVRIGGFHMQDEAARTLIYSLKSKSWRVIMNCPLYIGFMTSGVYFNGAVHWISSRGTIVALDLATEEYRELQAAPPPPRESPKGARWLYALDGHLVMSDADLDEMGRAWVMRGYGTDEPIWVDLFSPEERIVFSRVGRQRYRRPLPIAYSDSERRLIMHHDNRIIRWDIEKRSVKCVTIDGIPGFVTSFQVPTSLQVVPGSLFRFNGGGSTSPAAETTGQDATSNRLQLIATTIDSKRTRVPSGGLSHSGRGHINYTFHC